MSDFITVPDDVATIEVVLMDEGEYQLICRDAEHKSGGEGEDAWQGVKCRYDFAEYPEAEPIFRMQFIPKPKDRASTKVTFRKWQVAHGLEPGAGFSVEDLIGSSPWALVGRDEGNAEKGYPPSNVVKSFVAGA